MTIEGQTKAELQKRFPKASDAQIISMISFLWSGWEIDESEPNGSDDTINMINRQFPTETGSGYIRGDGIFRYT